VTFYADLGECRYFDRPEVTYVETDGRVITLGSYRPSDGGRLRAVGWLANELPGAPVDPSTLTKAVDALVRIWLANVDPWPGSFGRHGCGLCGAPPDRAPETEVVHKGKRLGLGAGFITVPASGYLYVAPSLVIHYMLAHGYQPPSEFLTALQVCPNPRSTAYLEALRPEGPSVKRVPEGD